MAVLPVKTSRGAWGGPHAGSFTPNGALQFHPNREGWSSSSPIWAARLFVGLSVGKKASWKIADVVRITKRVRTAQTGAPDSSFLAQRGIYKSRESGSVVEENAVQIVILNTPDLGLTGPQFRAQMVELAEALVVELKQEEVIVEIQRGGIVRETIGVVR